MNIKRLIPSNWFRHEEDQEQIRQLPIQRGNSQLYSPLLQLHKEIDRIFDSIYPGFGWGRMMDMDQEILRPNLDVTSTDKEYTITVEVPGVNENDVKLELTNDGKLTIIGEKKQEEEQKDKSFYRVERIYGSFKRTLSLPEDVNREAIEASFKNGLLTIRCPRSTTDRASAKNIEIKKAP